MDNYFINLVLATDGAENSITASMLYEANYVTAQDDNDLVASDEDEEFVYVGSRR